MRFIESGPYRVAEYYLRGKTVFSAWYRPDPRDLGTTTKLGEADSEESAKALCRLHAQKLRDAK